MKLIPIVSLYVLLGASAAAAPPNRETLKTALANLTANIENVDDRGFQLATKTMIGALEGLEARVNFSDECVVWPKPGPDGHPTDILLIAFMAGIVQERIFGDEKVALYRGWLNVIKYYQHYHAEGSIPKIAGLEEMIRQEKKGVLIVRARELQAKQRSGLFDHLDFPAKK